MSKELVSSSGHLDYHVGELRRTLKKIYEAREDMLRYPNTPKYDLIVNYLLPKLEAQVKDEKEQVEYWSKELEKAVYVGNDGYAEWYS